MGGPGQSWPVSLCRARFRFFLFALKSPAPLYGRLCDLFPIPLIGEGFIDALDFCNDGARFEATACLDSVVVGLSLLYCVRYGDIGACRPTVAQVEAHLIIIGAAVALHAHLIDSIGSRV